MVTRKWDIRRVWNEKAFECFSMHEKSCWQKRGLRMCTSGSRMSSQEWCRKKRNAVVTVILAKCGSEVPVRNWARHENVAKFSRNMSDIQPPRIELLRIYSAGQHTKEPCSSDITSGWWLQESSWTSSIRSSMHILYGAAWLISVTDGLIGYHLRRIIRKLFEVSRRWQQLVVLTPPRTCHTTAVA